MKATGGASRMVNTNHTGALTEEKSVGKIIEKINRKEKS